MAEGSRLIGFWACRPGTSPSPRRNYSSYNLVRGITCLSQDRNKEALVWILSKMVPSKAPRKAQRRESGPVFEWRMQGWGKRADAFT
jgi:hypothetical protein